MSNVTPLLLQDADIDWDKYILDEDDKRKLIDPVDLIKRIGDLSRGDGQYAGTPLPWEAVADKVSLKPGKLSLWAGINHHGKTAMLKQMALHWASRGQKTCFASFEEEPEETMFDMTRMLVPSERIVSGDDDWIEVACHWASNKIWLYDQQRIMSTNRILALITYAAQEKGCQHFVLDSLMRTALPQDDYEGQRIFVNNLTNYAKLLRIHIHLVHHIVKVDEEKVPGRNDIRGTGAITDQCDHVFLLWRNMKDQKGAEECDGYLVVAKNRGRPNWLGKIRTWMHPSGQFLRAKTDAPLQFLPGYRDAPPQLAQVVMWQDGQASSFDADI